MKIAKRRLSLTALWNAENGYRHVLRIAFPLVISTGSWSIKLFVDRMFLTWYSPEALAASMPAGMLNVALMSLFTGTAGYTSTFVAQYFGAGRHTRIGPSVWQGFYISLLGAMLMLALIPLASPFFAFVGHDPAVQENEVVYFRILCLGAFPAIGNAAASGFFAGRGRTWPVMWANIFGALVNTGLDYVLIFGYLGLSALGIRGAAIATVASASLQFALYLALIAGGGHNTAFHTIKGWRLDVPLLRRLLRYGFPNGIQFFVDMMGFAVFILLMGRLGTIPLAASNLAFNVNTLAFMPMIGVGIAVSVLVGQSLGRDRPDLASRSVMSGLHLALLYMGTIACLYAFTPDIFLKPFALNADKESFQAIRAIAVIALRYVAAYSLFDALAIVYSSALKGAGDTRYTMWVMTAAIIFALVLPTYVAIVLLQADLFVGWTIVTAYVGLVAIAFLFRYLGGKWKQMRVIESRPNTIPPTPIKQHGTD